MRILSSNQYNQGISKYKLLNSNAGVGAIITTIHGTYVLVTDINQWDFVNNSHNIIQNITKDENSKDWYSQSKKQLRRHGINVIDDPRFIDFIKKEKKLNNLICLIDIPALSLDDRFNTVTERNNPFLKELRNNGIDDRPERFMVKGVHFPKWFRNRKGELKKIEDWFSQWHNTNIRDYYFAPPRDINDPIKRNNGQQITKPIPLFHELIQTNLVLICPNGHLSDIPWSKFLRWKSDHKNDHAEGIFDYDDCCNAPKLKWTENKTVSEGYGSIYLECKNCHKKTNLEGINNIRPRCKGERPWVQNSLPETCKDSRGKKTQMQVSLVTSNNIYFATNFSSLFIPEYLATGKSKDIVKAIDILNRKFNSYLEFFPNSTREAAFNVIFNDNFFEENDISFADEKKAKNILKVEFLSTELPLNVSDDTHENYRWQEYQCFCNNSDIIEKGLRFNDVAIPQKLKEYFSKIVQVEELKETSIQFGFNRVRPNERILKDGELIYTSKEQNIYSSHHNDLFVLPAMESYGEGLFFQFEDESILNWIETLDQYNGRISSLIDGINVNQPGYTTKLKIEENGSKFFLIHTFSHLIMKELEFSCGYPTASLKERLYISPRMSGLLIYTAEGSEGSMGGLYSQGHPYRVEKLTINSLLRSIDCAADPLCWESDNQGILNLAGCFSCSMVSETSCEERNLGLDRRVLVDKVFGFFKELIY